MLDQLVESKNNGKETAQRAKFLVTTFTLVVSLAFSGVLWSLFAKDIAIKNDGMELSTMLAPVAIPETKPQPPEPIQQKSKSMPKTSDNENVRRTNTLRLEESPKVPNAISVAPSSEKARPNAPFRISQNAPESDFQSSTIFDRNSNNNAENGGGIGNSNKTESNNAEVINTIPPPPIVKKKPAEETLPKKTPIVSGGVMNGKAINLPKPIYSAAAKAVNANGDVSIQITVDESGKVISASAVKGHPLLRSEAEKAARSARFSPTLLSNTPVKVSGLIVYRFTK